MTSNDRKLSIDNDYASEGQNPPTTKAQDQILLIALKELIVQVVYPEGINDLNQIRFGSEATKLIAALQEFIASVVWRSESITNNTVVEVGLIEEDDLLQTKPDDDGKENPTPIIPSAKLHETAIMNKQSQELSVLENLQPTFQDKLLKGLREYVFNNMPIRMLCFEPHGSSLQITLIERGTIHGRLESVLRENMHNEAPLSVIRHPGMPWSVQELETDAEAIERVISKYARYAILSHTWLRKSGEVTYGDWIKGAFNAQDPGYQKLVNFSKVAWKDHGLALGWMDTVCINKDSSSELDESIRSMYKWYNRASVCITFLAETGTLPTMHADLWFTRGWTLQELLAPPFIKFYNSDWKRLVENQDNDKEDTTIIAQIMRATTISKDELESIRHAPISRRMQLAAPRQVTREEDTAYSLMGIFNISISTAYGEGAERAFFRLLQEILASPGAVLDVLNWAGGLPDSYPGVSHILPSSPTQYLKSDSSVFLEIIPIEPLTLTHLGLRVPVILMPAISTPLGKATPHFPIGDYTGIVDITPFGRIPYAPNTTYILLDKRVSGGDGPKEMGRYQLTLAVFNFDGNATQLSIRRPCIAKALYFAEGVDQVVSSEDYRPVYTDAPIVFDLTNRTVGNNFRKWHPIKRDKLGKHGMKLVTLYL